MFCEALIFRLESTGPKQGSGCKENSVEVIREAIPEESKETVVVMFAEF